MEYERLTPMAERYRDFRELESEREAAAQLSTDSDPQMRQLGAEEVIRLEQALAVGELELRRLLMPKDPRDERNIYLEIRAGTGGDEAAIFAGDLLRIARGEDVGTIVTN